MDISVLFQQIFDTLSKATELAISNNKAIAALTQQQAELTAKLTEAVADDEEDAAKIAAFEEEKLKQESAIADVTKKLEELKAQIEATPPVDPIPAPPVEPTPEPVPPVSEVPVEPPVVIDPAVPVEPSVEVIPAENSPPTGTIGVFEQVVMPNSPQIF